MCCSAFLQRVAVRCCSVLQSVVAVCCSALLQCDISSPPEQSKILKVSALLGLPYKFTIELDFEKFCQSAMLHVEKETQNAILARCNTLQSTATRCNTLQHTAKHCNTPQHTATTHCNTLQHQSAILRAGKKETRRIAQINTRCNTLQHTTTHCNTPQHTPTHAITR